MNETLINLNYQDTKIVTSFNKKDVEVTVTLINKVQDKLVLYKFRDYPNLFVPEWLSLFIDYNDEELLEYLLFYVYKSEQSEPLQFLLENHYFENSCSLFEKGFVNDSEIIDLVIRHEKDKIIALETACSYGRSDIIKELLSDKVKISVFGWEMAAYQHDILELLLEESDQSYPIATFENMLIRKDYSLLEIILDHDQRLVDYALDFTNDQELEKWITDRYKKKKDK